MPWPPPMHADPMASLIDESAAIWWARCAVMRLPLAPVWLLVGRQR